MFKRRRIRAIRGDGVDGKREGSFFLGGTATAVNTGVDVQYRCSTSASKLRPPLVVFVLPKN